MNPGFSSLQRELNKLVLQAGDMIGGALFSAKNVRKKGRVDLVTETDLAVEEFLKEKLLQLEPASRFLAEETASENVLEGLTWIIDPLDGTTNFTHGFPFVATSVALWYEGQLVLGTVNIPAMRELFTARKGAGSLCNDTPISVTATSQLEDCLVATGFPYQTQAYIDRILAQMRNMLLTTQGIRRPGAAAVDLAYLACGRYDVFYEYALKPWDTAAGCLLIEEAGGRVSRMDCTPYSLGNEDILASNGRVHRQACELLQSALIY
jgi:myo-inositol-1(or 4)-monophosphatase